MVPGPRLTLHNIYPVSLHLMCVTPNTTCQLKSRLYRLYRIVYILQVLTGIPIVAEQSSKQVDCFVGKDKRREKNRSTSSRHTITCTTRYSVQGGRYRESKLRPCSALTITVISQLKYSTTMASHSDYEVLQAR